MNYHDREAAYRAADGLNQSALKPLRKSPMHARHEADSQRKQTASMALGTLTERLLVVPDDIRTIAANRATTAGKALAAEAESRGELVVTPSDWESAHRMAAAIRASKRAQALLAGCEFCQPCYWRVGNQKRKALFDAVDTSRHLIVDIKTTSDELTTSGLARTASKWGYDIQAAWYSQGYAAVHGVVPEFWFLFVESAAPHAVVAVQLDADWLAHASDEMETKAAVWQQCSEAGVWPGPAEMMADSGKLTLSRPTWAPTYTVGE